MASPAYNLNALNPQVSINTVVDLIRKSPENTILPDIFYTKQLLDTIRLDVKHYVYYRYADSQPINGIANTNVLRRWSPLQAHTIPLAEGIPPTSDKGSVEKFEITAAQYGRYMEFSDKVNFAMVDPIIAHYTREYSIVAIETLDMLAKAALEEVANPFYAGLAKGVEGLNLESKPSLMDLRKIVLSFKRLLVKPRSNGRYHVIAGPEFYFDMIDDEYVKQYMTINQSTYSLYDNAQLVPLFELEFYETLADINHGRFFKGGKEQVRLIGRTADGTVSYISIAEDATFTTTGGTVRLKTIASGYVKDPRTGQDASYIPLHETWHIDELSVAASNNAITAISGITINDSTAATIEAVNGKTWTEFKVAHVYVLGAECLTKTGLQGQDSAKMYVKPLGSAGVLDPVDQRQSIGFKINSVGFGSIRPEAVVDYVCVPSQLNM